MKSNLVIKKDKIFNKYLYLYATYIDGNYNNVNIINAKLVKYKSILNNIYSKLNKSKSILTYKLIRY